MIGKRLKKNPFLVYYTPQLTDYALFYIWCGHKVTFCFGKWLLGHSALWILEIIISNNYSLIYCLAIDSWSDASSIKGKLERLPGFSCKSNSF